MIATTEAGSGRSLSHRERGGVRGFGLSFPHHPPHPNPLPSGEREPAEFAAVRGFSLSVPGNPLTPTLSPNGERERAECAAGSCNLP